MSQMPFRFFSNSVSSTHPSASVRRSCCMARMIGKAISKKIKKRFRPSRPNRNPAKLIGVIRKHDLTNKKTTTKTNTKTMTNTFREHLQEAIFETFDLCDIWSEWGENMTWPIKRQRRRQIQKTKTNTFREHLQRAILDTCDHWDIWSEWWGNMTWPTKRQRQRQRQRQWQIHLENTFKEQSLKLFTFETFD